MPDVEDLDQIANEPPTRKRRARRNALVEVPAADPGDGPFKNRIIGHAMVDPKSLRMHPDNWRIHPEHQQEILRGSLTDFGWSKSLQVQKATMTVVDGHARVVIAIEAGAALVPVEWVDLTDEEVRKAIASLDSISFLADPDYEALQRTLNGIGETDSRLVLLFDDLEAQINDAMAMSKQYEGREKTNFHSVQKAFKDRKVVIKGVFPLADAELVERALEATGKINRAEAMGEIAKHYLSTKGKANDSHPTGKLNLSREDELKASIARSLGR
jgi:ParB-like chromosome segregation protein Spo0J